MDGDLEGLSGPEENARAAFDRLMPHLVRFLRSILRKRLRDENAIEEVMGNVLTKLWSARKGYRHKKIALWWGYVRTAAHACACDYYHSMGRETPTDWNDEQPSDDEWDLLDMLARAALLKRAFTAADELWLGASSETCPSLESRVLAMQLFYEDRQPWREVVALTGAASRAELNEWLADDAALIAWAYREFYMANDALCAAILGCTEGDLDRLAGRCGDPPAGWTWEETTTVLRRFRNGLLAAQMLRFTDGLLTAEDLESLIARCIARFPAREAAGRLKCELGERLEAVRRSGVWRRLAFQYYYVDDLPVKQILERCDSAAAVVEHDMSLGTLNMWLSGNRLGIQLAAYLLAGGR